jgi:hypothetical protein
VRASQADDGSESSVPQYEVYNHHSSVVLTAEDMTSVVETVDLNTSSHAISFALPFWTRRTPLDERGGHTRQSARQVVPFAPSKWAMASHVINTHPPEWRGDLRLRGPSPLMQCPCTSQRHFDLAAKTIDGVPFPGPCAAEMVGNNVCDLSTYTGGVYCCTVDETFLIDTAQACNTSDCAELPVERFYMKTTITYEDAFPSARQLNTLNLGSRAVRLVNHDAPLEGTQPGVTFSGPTLATPDYEVMPCPYGTAPHECIHLLSWIEPVTLWHNDNGTFRALQNASFRVVHSYPHVHTSIVSATLQDATTNQTLCELSAANGGIIYGAGSKAGDELGYAVGQRACAWSDEAEDAPRLVAGQLMRFTFVYNASEHHTGVMAKWYLNVAGE